LLIATPGLVFGPSLSRCSASFSTRHSWLSQLSTSINDERTQGVTNKIAQIIMSEPELAYMTGNEDFDLPRWQTQTNHDSIVSSAQSASNYYSPAPPPSALSSHRIPQIIPSSTGSSRQPRIAQIVEEDNQFGINSLPYATSNLSRSVSMGASAANSRRRHHLPDDLEGALNVDSSHKAPSYSNAASLYPSSVAFQSQSLNTASSDAISPGTASGSPYQEMYYSTSPTHPPKRAQTQHDPSTSSQSSRSPMRLGNISTPSLLDTYTSEQPSYSPTPPGYAYADQNKTYGSKPYQSHSRNNSNTDPLASSDNSSYIPQPSSYPHGGSSNSPQPSAATSPTHLTAQRSIRQNSSSMPNTPLSFAHPAQLPDGATHYYPQEPQPMMVEVSQKRRSAGFRRVRDHNDLRPALNRPSNGRRMDAQGIYLNVSLDCIYIASDTLTERVM
jgi:dual specificity protein kinase YAK1